MTVSYSGLTVVAGTVITSTWGNMMRDAGVVPHATAAARTSAVTSPLEAMFSYRTDGKLYESYDGTSWVATARYNPMVRKGSNESLNSTTALQNDNDLVLSVAASGVYRLELDLFYTSGVTPDFKIGWTYPAGLTMVWGGTYADTAGAVVIPGNLIQTSVPAIGGSGGDLRAFFTGTVVVSATAGSLQLQWAQNTSDAGTTTVYGGSSMSLIRIS